MRPGAGPVVRAPGRPGRRDDVARELHVHPQTVRYRMTQIRARYGDRLQDPAAVRDLVLAL